MCYGRRKERNEGDEELSRKRENKRDRGKGMRGRELERYCMGFEEEATKKRREN